MSKRKNKPGFQTDPSRLKGIPPTKLVQMNSLQPSALKRWCIAEAKRRGVSLSMLIRQCLQKEQAEQKA